MNARVEFGDTIRRLRLKSGLSVTRLSVEVRCSRNQIYKVEAGRGRPSPGLLRRLGRIFGVSLLETWAPRLWPSRRTLKPRASKPKTAPKGKDWNIATVHSGTFGEIVRGMRRFYKLEGKRLAELVDRRGAYISAIENDRCGAPQNRELIEAIAGVLGVDAEWLVHVAAASVRAARAMEEERRRVRKIWDALGPFVSDSPWLRLGLALELSVRPEGAMPAISGLRRMRAVSQGTARCRVVA